MLGDEEHENIESVLTNLNDENFVNRIRSKIVDNKTFPSDYYQSIYFNEENHGTTHLSVLASNGDAVSLSSTINL
jgi:gamma-glutamyltranspeptidase/glutathione hydrolase/leukotriene-C4 hydrolase